MSVEANKQLITQLFEDLDDLTRGQVDFSKFYHPHFVSHMPVFHIEAGAQLDRFSSGIGEFSVKIKEVHWEPHLIMGDGDYVADRWTLRLVLDAPVDVRHVGSVDVSGKELLVQGATIGRIQDGKIIEIWNYDNHYETFLSAGLILPSDEPQTAVST